MRQNTVYPCLPGHEIVGRVVKVGAAVTKFKEGDLAGVGCMIDSCQSCAPCKEGLEQYCEGPKGMTATYNGPQKPDGTNTFGGYSNNIVVTEKFVLKVPENLDLKAVAPLLCAGITTIPPMDPSPRRNMDDNQERKNFSSWRCSMTKCYWSDRI